MRSEIVHELAIAKQTGKGVIPVLAAYRLPLVGGTVMPGREHGDVEETNPDGLLRQSYIAGAGVDGQPEYAVRLEPLPLLLELAQGTLATTGAADPWTHTGTIGALQWLTLWRMLGDLVYEKFVDCKIGQLVLTSESNRPVRVQFTVVGIDARTLDLTTYTTEVVVAANDGKTLMHYDGAGSFQVEGVVVSSLERIVLTINNNVARQPGDNVRANNLSTGRRQILLETTQEIIDRDLYNRYHYGSANPAAGTQQSKATTELAAGVDFLWTQQAAPERSLRVQAPRVEAVGVAGYEPAPAGNPLKRRTSYRVLKPNSGSALTTITNNGENGSKY